MCHRQAEILRTPGFHGIAGSDLHGNPLADGPAMRSKERIGPVSTLGWHGHRQWRKGAGTAPSHGVEIHQVEPIESSMPVQIRKVGQPGVLDNRTAVRPCRNPSQVWRANVRRQQAGLASEGEIDDAVVPHSS